MHDLYAMLNINAVWYNCRLLHVEENPITFEGEMIHVEIYKDLKSNTSENEYSYLG